VGTISDFITVYRVGGQCSACSVHREIYDLLNSFIQVDGPVLLLDIDSDSVNLVGVSVVNSFNILILQSILAFFLVTVCSAVHFQLALSPARLFWLEVLVGLLRQR
jgi:hypothetical protein